MWMGRGRRERASGANIAAIECHNEDRDARIEIRQIKYLNKLRPARLFYSLAE